jgi:2-polyprenyl-3-methyl-5-hydroxy-6-metoxy-1,4-benzoquinol methylase
MKDKSYFNFISPEKAIASVRGEKDYEFYLEDQKKDGIFPDERVEEGRGWTHQYCNHLIKKLPKDYDFSDKKILEVGAREFFSYEFFRDKFSVTPTGIDICEKGIEKSKDKGIIELDAHFLDEHFDSDSFDLVMSLHALEHMYDMHKVLRNCNKVLKSGGYLYFAVPIPSFNSRKGHWFDIPSVEKMTEFCEDAGFKKVYTEFFSKEKFRPEPDMIGLFQKC